MNYSLITGCVLLALAVMTSLLSAYDQSLDILAAGLYAGSLYGILMGMLDSKDGQDNEDW
jgi:hypothetical protein